MKRFEDLTDQELVALTGDEIQLYIDYACADRGLPLLPKKLDPPPPVVLKEDREVFCIYRDINFLTMEDAIAVMEVLAKHPPVGLDWASCSTPSGVSNYYINKEERLPSVETKRVWSKAKIDEVRSILSGAAEAQKLYEASVKAYDNAVSTRQDVTDWIGERLSEARQREYERTTFVQKYERYLVLADGCVSIARKFLLNAEPNAKERVPELFESPIEITEASDKETKVFHADNETISPAEAIAKLTGRSVTEEQAHLVVNNLFGNKV